VNFEQKQICEENIIHSVLYISLFNLFCAKILEIEWKQFFGKVYGHALVVRAL